mmetsp:Transcript_12223/g.31276  ORF Transcript_12223/g.31276 Transcript_12223/m.31276 type:complete len:248 (+) Transcript_12223:896-1639(+)
MLCELPVVVVRQAALVELLELLVRQLVRWGRRRHVGGEDLAGDVDKGVGPLRRALWPLGILHRVPPGAGSRQQRDGVRRPGGRLAVHLVHHADGQRLLAERQVRHDEAGAVLRALIPGQGGPHVVAPVHAGGLDGLLPAHTLQLKLAGEVARLADLLPVVPHVVQPVVREDAPGPAAGVVVLADDARGDAEVAVVRERQVAARPALVRDLAPIVQQVVAALARVLAVLAAVLVVLIPAAHADGDDIG